MKNEENNKNKYPRVPYPVSCRPCVTIDGNDYILIDISESGIRFKCERQDLFQPGTDIEVVITFHDNESFNTVGRVVRINEKFSAVIMALKECIPMDRLEQQKEIIREHHPDFFRD